MSLEIIHQFEMCGCRFTVLWDTGSCLLRVTEGYASGDTSSYIAADLSQRLYVADSGDCQVTAEEAIKAAPLIAEMLLVEAREQELGFMPRLVNSEEMQKEYPAYQVLRLWQSNGDSAIMVWSSHIHNLFLGRDGTWEWLASPASLEEAERILDERYGLSVARPDDNDFSPESCEKLPMFDSISVSAFCRDRLLIWFVPVYFAIVAGLSLLGWSGAAHFCRWFLLACLAVVDLWLRCGNTAVSDGGDGGLSRSLLDRLTFNDSGLTILDRYVLPVAIWSAALLMSVVFYFTC